MQRKKIRILVDLDSMAISQKSGVGYYCSGLLESLSKAAGNEAEIVGHYFDFLGRSKSKMPKLPNVRYRRSLLVPRQVINLMRRLGIPIFYELLIKARGDFILFPNFIGHKSLLGTPMAPVIHDLTFIARPQDMAKKNLLDLTKFVPTYIKRARFVVAISESTKQAIIEQYSTPSKKIIVSLMVPPQITTPVWRKPEIELPKKYILFFGTLDLRKNFMGLIQAYSAQLKPDIRSKYALVLAGGVGWQNQQALSKIATLQEQGLNIVLTGYVDEKTKSYLYKNASIFVLPSHYEGFGIPILEAMAYGTPIAVSDIPVFHEVAGKAAQFFDQNKPEDIAKTIENILVNQALAKQLIAAGHENLKRFSRDEEGKKVYNKIKSVVKK